MKSLLYNSIVFLIVWTALFQLYCRIFRPLVLARLRLELFDVRRAFRGLVLSEKIAAEGPLHNLLELQFSHCLNAIYGMTFVHVLLGKPSLTAVSKTDEILAVVENASAPVRIINERLFRVLVGAALVNTPFLVLLVLILSPLIVAFMVGASWFNRLWDDLHKSKRFFWGVVYYQAEVGCTVGRFDLPLEPYVLR